MLSADRGGHVKFVDFGFSKMLKGDGKTSTNCGTAVYIAPEILVGEAHDHRVDVWSLGVLICELLSGKTPFEAKTTQQVYEKVARGIPSLNRHVTPTARSLL